MAKTVAKDYGWLQLERCPRNLRNAALAINLLERFAALRDFVENGACCVIRTGYYTLGIVIQTGFQDIIINIFFEEFVGLFMCFVHGTTHLKTQILRNYHHDEFVRHHSKVKKDPGSVAAEFGEFF